MTVPLAPPPTQPNPQPANHVCQNHKPLPYLFHILHLYTALILDKQNLIPLCVAFFCFWRQKNMKTLSGTVGSSCFDFLKCWPRVFFCTQSSSLLYHCHVDDDGDDLYLLLAVLSVHVSDSMMYGGDDDDDEVLSACVATVVNVFVHERFKSYTCECVFVCVCIQTHISKSLSVQVREVNNCWCVCACVRACKVSVWSYVLMER